MTAEPQGVRRSPKYRLSAAPATEPILPLELFTMRIFPVSDVVAFISGVAMFGALAFLPQYQQLVHGV
jgi:hypothetical protein